MTEFEAYSSTHPVVKLEEDYNNILDHAFEKPFTYLIRNNGGTYEAIDGSTGKIADSNATLNTLVTAMLTAMTSGTLYLKEVAFDLALMNSITANCQVVCSYGDEQYTYINSADAKGSQRTIAVGSGINLNYYLTSDIQQNILDASANASTLIQTVFDDAAVHEIKFTADTFALAATGVTLSRDNVIVEGSGETSTSFTYSGVGTAITISGSAIDLRSRIVLRDFAVVGDGVNALVGLDVNYAVHDSYMSNVRANGFLNVQIELDNCWTFTVFRSWVGGSGIGSYGFKISNANGVNLYSPRVLNINNTNGIGIYADDIDAFGVYGATVEDLNVGIQLYSGTRGSCTISNLYLENLEGADAKGVYVGADSGKVLESVVISGHFAIAADETGVYVDYAEHVRIENSAFSIQGNSIITTANALDVSYTNSEVLGVVSAGIRNLDAPSIWLSAEQFYSNGVGSAALATVGAASSTYRAFQLDDSATEEIAVQAMMPHEWGNGTIYVYVVYATNATSGAATLSAVPAAIGVNEDLRASSFSSYNLAVSGTSNGLSTSNMVNWKTTVAAGDLISITIRRTGGGGGDTLVGDLNILGAYLVYIPS
jgi:hypothetical protein